MTERRGGPRDPVDAWRLCQDDNLAALDEIRDKMLAAADHARNHKVGDEIELRRAVLDELHKGIKALRRMQKRITRYHPDRDGGYPPLPPDCCPVCGARREPVQGYALPKEVERVG